VCVGAASALCGHPPAPGDCSQGGCSLNRAQPQQALPTPPVFQGGCTPVGCQEERPFHTWHNMPRWASAARGCPLQVAIQHEVNEVNVRSDGNGVTPLLNGQTSTHSWLPMRVAALMPCCGTRMPVRRGWAKVSMTECCCCHVAEETEAAVAGHVASGGPLVAMFALHLLTAKSSHWMSALCVHPMAVLGRSRCHDVPHACALVLGPSARGRAPGGCQHPTHVLRWASMPHRTDPSTDRSVACTGSVDVLTTYFVPTLWGRVKPLMTMRSAVSYPGDMRGWPSPLTGPHLTNRGTSLSMPSWLMKHMCEPGHSTAAVAALKYHANMRAGTALIEPSAVA
jgi:hypothetical protein